MSTRLDIELVYDADRPIEGVMSKLLPKLEPVLDANGLRVSLDQLTDECLSVFLRKNKRVFHIRLLRRDGKWVVRMGGNNPAEIRDATRVSRDHFDAWFGVKTNDA